MLYFYVDSSRYFFCCMPNIGQEFSHSLPLILRKVLVHSRQTIYLKQSSEITSCPSVQVLGAYERMLMYQAFKTTLVSLVHLDPTVSLLCLQSRNEQYLAGLRHTVLQSCFISFTFSSTSHIVVRLLGFSSVLILSRRSPLVGAPVLCHNQSYFQPKGFEILLVYYLNLLSMIGIPLLQ